MIIKLANETNEYKSSKTNLMIMKVENKINDHKSNKQNQ